MGSLQYSNFYMAYFPKVLNPSNVQGPPFTINPKFMPSWPEYAFKMGQGTNTCVCNHNDCQHCNLQKSLMNCSQGYVPKCGPNCGCQCHQK